MDSSTLRFLERQAALDLQQSFKGGNLNPVFAAAVRAAEAAYMLEQSDTHPINRRAKILSWAGVRCIDLPLLAQAIPLLRTYAEQAENEGERSLATKAIAVINEILETPYD